jgi:hypothetical protein
VFFAIDTKIVSGEEIIKARRLAANKLTVRDNEASGIISSYHQ